MSIRAHRERVPSSRAERSQVWLPDLVYRMMETERGEGAPLLPETADLLGHLARGSCAEDLDSIEPAAPGRVAAYRALPEMNLPFLRFHIDKADPGLLAFAGRSVSGFEVLEAMRAGFQYHWRRDLVRTCDERLPLLGHLCGLSETGELVVDHLTVPVIRKGRVREVRGWLIFGKDLREEDPTDRLESITVFRRAGSSRSVRLPGSLLRPRVEAARLQELLTSLRRHWNGHVEQGGAG